MEERKIKILDSIISIIFLFPAIILSITQSVFLIQKAVGYSVFEKSFVSFSLIIYIVFLLNMIFVISGAILLLIQFFLIQENNEKEKNIGVFSKVILILSSFFSITTIWIVNNVTNLFEQISFYETCGGCVFLFVFSTMFYVFEKFYLKKNYIKNQLLF